MSAQRHVLFAFLGLVLAGCAGPEDARLERVAKDWCLTIRASQVIPVYPLNEDVQPGDVYLVPLPISRQTELYEERGFLPLDQLVTRMTADVDDYERFYGPHYLQGIDGLPTARPGWADDAEPVRLPMAGFPTYTFQVDRSGGLGLALPIQAVPVGLALMGASRAAGSVAIKDAYSYALPTDVLYRHLARWWDDNPDAARTLTALAREMPDGVYLRVVSRVFLTRKVAVSLASLDAASAGLDVGVAPELALIDLALTDPAAAEASAAAYRAALDAVAGRPGLPEDGDGLGAAAQALNAAQPGGALRYVQVSRRAVAMEEDFERPLVIGYTGFDVRVRLEGGLSVPIPSFSVVSGRTPTSAFDAAGTRAFGRTPGDEAFAAWLEDEENEAALARWLDEEGIALTPTDLLYPADPARAGVMRLAMRRFGIDGGESR